MRLLVALLLIASLMAGCTQPPVKPDAGAHGAEGGNGSGAATAQNATERPPESKIRPCPFDRMDGKATTHAEFECGTTLAPGDVARCPAVEVRQMDRAFGGQVVAVNNTCSAGRIVNLGFHAAMTLYAAADTGGIAIEPAQVELWLVGTIDGVKGTYHLPTQYLPLTGDVQGFPIATAGLPGGTFTLLVRAYIRGAPSETLLLDAVGFNLTAAAHPALLSLEGELGTVACESGHRMPERRQDEDARLLLAGTIPYQACWMDFPHVLMPANITQVTVRVRIVADSPPASTVTLALWAAGDPGHGYWFWLNLTAGWEYQTVTIPVTPPVQGEQRLELSVMGNGSYGTAYLDYLDFT